MLLIINSQPKTFSGNKSKKLLERYVVGGIFNYALILVYKVVCSDLAKAMLKLLIGL